MDDKQLSKRVYNILEEVGASEEMRQYHQRTATTQTIQQSIVRSLLHGINWEELHCGSWYEGSVTPDLASDIDIISSCTNVSVTLDPSAIQSEETILIVSNSWTYPGYAKLQSVLDGKPQFIDDIMPTESYFSDYVGRICLNQPLFENRNGPAEMVFGQNGEHEKDLVCAFKCETLLPSAIEWMMRPRPYDRPSNTQLQNMRGMPFMLVPVGYKKSCEKRMEWRLSYTKQEKLLMTSLNPVQHKVYVLLKMINKDILRPRFKEQMLTSYHWKTCILYAVEMTPECVWIRDNLIDCLLQCLRLMAVWLEMNHCPSYFTKDANLFTKDGFSRGRLSLLSVMRELIQSKSRLLFSLQSDNVGLLLLDGYYELYRAKIIKRHMKYILKQVTRQLEHLYALVRCIIKHISHDLNDHFFIGRVLEYFQGTTRPNSIAHESIECILPWLHLHEAKRLACVACELQNDGYRQQLMEKAMYHFNEARDTDFFNERLAVASVLLTFGKYEECFPILQQLEREFLDSVYGMRCTCGDNTIHITVNHRNSSMNKRKRIYSSTLASKLSVKDITRMTAGCVVFLPAEAALAPDPLRYEMQRSLHTQPGSRNNKEHYWFDWAVIDPRVYLHFLQYLVSRKLQRNRPTYEYSIKIRRLIALYGCAIIQGAHLLYHKDTAYNLLGWIHIQDHKMAEAFLCFAESWKIRPHHNAAKFHVIDWLKRLSGRRTLH